MQLYLQKYRDIVEVQHSTVVPLGPKASDI